MSATVDWSEREPEHYRRADELLMMEQSRERVILQLIAAHLPEADAVALVEQAWADGRARRRDEGQRELELGWWSMSVGVLVYLLMEQSRSGLGAYVRNWLCGVLFFHGAVSVYRGWKKLVS